MEEISITTAPSNLSLHDAEPADQTGASEGASCPISAYDGYLGLSSMELRQELARRDRVEKELRSSEELYRALFELSPLAKWTYDAGTLKFLDVNQATLELYGYTREELKTMRVIDIEDPEDCDPFSATLAEQAVGHHVRRHLRKDGTALSIDLNVHELRLGGRPMMVVLARDITERLREEEALLESQRVLEETQETGGVGSWAADLHTGKVYWSKNAFRLFGINPDAFDPSLDAFLTLVHPDDQERVAGIVGAVPGDQLGHDVEYRTILPDGTLRWIHGRSRLVCDSAGRPLRLQGIELDITERKQAEQRLEHSLSLLQATLESTTDGVLVVDRNGKVVTHNRVFTNIWGLPEAWLNNPKPEQRLAEIAAMVRDPEAFTSRILELLQEPDERSFDLLEMNDGRVFERYSQPQVIGGRSVGRVWNFRDVTERQQAEEERQKLEQQLLQSQKMEAIGTLAGGIAHDFNNILYAIIGYGELVLESIDQGSQASADQAEVLTAAHRAAELVQHILAFSRKNKTKPMPVSVGAVIKEVLRMLRASLPSTISVAASIEAKDGTVMADPSQLHQVLMNLCTNAGQSMAESGGLLEVSLRDYTVGENESDSSRGLAPGEYLLLSVEDSGHGIPLEIRDRIFDPFFTTKEVGAGTGLGLSTVHGIVTTMGGIVTVYSEIGRGTAFHVYLPAVPAAATAQRPEASSLPTGSERILLVDDEPSLVRMGHDMLDRLGYNVVAVRSSLEAWEIFQARPADFDLLVTDQTMPGMTGAELAQKILALRPGLPIILCTGFSQVLSEERARELGLAEYLLKPFATRDLAHAVRRLLDAKKNAPQ